METVLLILAKTASIWLTAVSYSMLARVLLPIFGLEESGISVLAYFISEPAVLPVRSFMEKREIGTNSPMDLPFLVTYIIVMVVRWFLP